MFRLSSQLSYLSILPPKEILSKVSDLEDFERIGQRETFWKKVWRKWVSPRLLEFRGRKIPEILYGLVEEAKRLTPENLLREGSKRGILFYVIEALER